MPVRGTASWKLVSTGSNTTIKATPGSLYALQVTPGNGGTVRVDGSANLGATPNLNTTGTDTIGLYGPYSMTSNTVPVTITFGPGIGFEGLSLAATSNTRTLAIYE
jgi:hypothetical protein